MATIPACRNKTRMYVCACVQSGEGGFNRQTGHRLWRAYILYQEIWIFFFFLKNIYLAALGLRCGMQGLSVAAFKCLVAACGIQFPDQESNPEPPSEFQPLLSGRYSSDTCRPDSCLLILKQPFKWKLILLFQNLNHYLSSQISPK